MTRKTLSFSLALVPLLAGCASTSFAPPSINTTHALADDGACKRSSATSITPNTADGARQLIDNYFVAYDCASRNLANGRQGFEIPSALALAGGAAAAAFGAGPDVAIATGGAAALFTRGNSYWAPKAKRHIVSAALSAVVCIQQEAVGIPALDFSTAKSASQKFGVAASNTERDDPPALRFDPELQYYQMVKAALRETHLILGERLDSVGSYSAGAIASDINDLAKKKAAAESPEAQQNAKDAVGPPPTGATDADKAVVVNSIVELGKLQPRLQLCVVRAKSG